MDGPILEKKRNGSSDFSPKPKKATRYWAKSESERRRRKGGGGRNTHPSHGALETAQKLQPSMVIESPFRFSGHLPLCIEPSTS